MSILLLDISCAPLALVRKQRAIGLLYKGEAESFDGLGYHSQVIRLSRPTKGSNVSNKIPFSRRALFMRDEFRCAYCDKQVTLTSGTIDHIIPKSRFSGSADHTSFENTVVACSRCNSYKGNRLLSECNLKLLKEPRIPSIVLVRWFGRHLTKSQAQYISNYYKVDYGKVSI